MLKKTDKKDKCITVTIIYTLRDGIIGKMSFFRMDDRRKKERKRLFSDWSESNERREREIEGERKREKEGERERERETERNDREVS